MSVTDELLENNEKYATDVDGPLPLPPSGGRAVVGSPFVPHTDQVRGFVFDVATGRLREVV